MADPLVVLVFLASVGPPDATDSAMTLAARQALGPNAVVLVERRPTLPTLADAQSFGERERVAAVVEVDWADPTHTHATVRAHSMRRDGWADRDITFLAADPPDECGRTIGFAIASLIEPGDKQEPGHEPTHKDDAPRSPWLMIDAAAVGTLGGGPGTNAAGAEVAGLVVVHPRLAAVAVAAVRFGDIAGADSTFTSVQVGGGAAWRAIVLPTPGPLELDVRVDVLATCFVASRRGESQSSWQPGARTLVEAAWFPFAPSIGLIGLVGGEAAFGTATIVVGARPVATVPEVRAVGQLGLRARF